MPTKTNKTNILKQQNASNAEYMSQPGFGKEVAESDLLPEINPEVVDKIAADIDMSRKYDQPVQAFAEGAARGLVPVSDVVLTKGLGISAKDIQARREYNPVASGAGELSTLIGSTVLGGESALANLTIGGAATSLEKGVLKAVTKNVFKNQAEKKIFQNIIEKSASNAVSGAAFGANQLLNEAALGNADLTGENFLSYAGTGAVLNGLVGGAFGAVESVAPLVGTAADRATGQLKRTFAKEIDPVRAFSELASDHAQGRAVIYEQLKKLEPEELKDFVVKKLKLNAVTDTEQLWKNNKQFLKDGGEYISSIYKAADALAPGGLFSKQELHGLQRQTILDFVDKNANLFDSKAAKSTVSGILESIDNRFVRVPQAQTAQEVHNLLQSYQKAAKPAFGAGPEAALASQIHADLYLKTRNALQDKIASAADNSEMANLANDLRLANKQYSTALTIDKYLSKRAATKSGFSEMKNGLLGTVGAVGLLSGDEHGTQVGALALTASLGAKFLNSDMRRRLVILNGMERANQESSKKISHTIKSILNIPVKGAKAVIHALPKSSLMYSGLSIGPNRKKSENDKQAFSNIQTNLADFQSNPQKLTDRIAINTLKSNSVAPNATVYAQAAIRRGVQFLSEKIPKDMYIGSDLTGKKVWEPSGMQMAQFKRYVQVVEHPYSILVDLEKGTLTREHVEALKTVYPAIYSSIRDNILGEIRNSPQSVSYSKKIQLGILLNSPTDASLRPDNIMALQANFQPEPEQQGSNSAVNTTVKGTQNIKKSERMSTGMQQAQNGIED